MYEEGKSYRGKYVELGTYIFDCGSLGRFVGVWRNCWGRYGDCTGIICHLPHSFFGVSRVGFAQIRAFLLMSGLDGCIIHSFVCPQVFW